MRRPDVSRGLRLGASYVPLDGRPAVGEAADDPQDRVVVLLGATAGLRAQEMIALLWDGDTTWVTLPARTDTGEWSDAGEMKVLGKGGTT